MVDVDMDEARFAELVEAYGAEARRWPDAERARALRYLVANPAARARRLDEGDLDALLDAWLIDEPSAALGARAMAARPRPRLRPGAVWLSGVGLAAACVLGLLVGANVGQANLTQPASSERDGDAAVAAALNGSGEFAPNLDEASS